MAEVKWIKLSQTYSAIEKLNRLKAAGRRRNYGIWVQILCLAGQINDNGMVFFLKTFPYRRNVSSELIDL